MAPLRAGAACAVLMTVIAGGSCSGGIAPVAGWVHRPGDGTAAFVAAPSRSARRGNPPPWATAGPGVGRHLPTALPIMRHIASTIAGYRSSAEEDAATENGNNAPGRQRPDDDDDDMDDAPEAPAVAGIERAWRHARKPLLSIGAKGATLAHGNSLRQLLEAHGAVKVKANTKQFDNSLVVAFETLAALAQEAGLPEKPELLHVRASENTILVGLHGTRARIEAGEFPPPPPPPREPSGDGEAPRRSSGGGKGKKRKLMP